MAIDRVGLDVPTRRRTRPPSAARPRAPARVARSRRYGWWDGVSAARTPVIVAALGPLSTGERDLAQRVLDELTEGMLVIIDRGFSARIRRGWFADDDGESGRGPGVSRRSTADFSTY
jgi:hypothetical protein